MKIEKIGMCGLIVVLVLVIAASGCTSSNNSTNSPQSSNVQSNSGSASSGSSSGSSNAQSVSVVINYMGAWSGAITSPTGSQNIDGSGNKVINLGTVSGNVAVNAQKKDTSSDKITVSIQSGGKTVATQSSTAQYGIASTTATV